MSLQAKTMNCFCTVCHKPVECVDCFVRGNDVAVRLSCHGQIEEFILHAEDGIYLMGFAAPFRNVHNVECANG